MKKINVSCSGAALVDLDELNPTQGNLKDLTKENYTKLKKQILKNGFSFPFHIWKDGKVMRCIDGHQRIRTLKAMRDEGYYIPKLPVDYIDAKDEKHAKELILANISEYGNMTQQGLYEFIETAEIDFKDLVDDYRLPEIDTDSFIDEFYKELEDEDKEEQEDTVPEAPKVPVVQLGDLIELGEHRLVCGDSTCKDTVDKLMDGDKADMVFTDPPYGVDYDGGVQTKRKKLSSDDKGTTIYRDILPIIYSIMNENSALYIWHAAGYADMAKSLWDNKFEIRSQIIWNKNHAQFGALSAQYKQKHEPCFYCFKKGSPPNWCGPTNEVTVWDIDRESKNDFHPTQKPVELAERAIKNHTSKSVLDLFGGSGSTLIACEKTKRKCYMMELDPIYCDVIVKRYCDYVKNDKIKINGKSVSWSDLSKNEE